MLVSALLTGCGDQAADQDTDVDAGLSRAEVAEIVRAELADGPAPTEPGLSRADVEEIVGAPPGG